MLNTAKVTFIYYLWNNLFGIVIIVFMDCFVPTALILMYWYYRPLKHYPFVTI